MLSLYFPPNIGYRYQRMQGREGRVVVVCRFVTASRPEGESAYLVLCEPWAAHYAVEELAPGVQLHDDEDVLKCCIEKKSATAARNFRVTGRYMCPRRALRTAKCSNEALTVSRTVHRAIIVTYHGGCLLYLG